MSRWCPSCRAFGMNYPCGHLLLSYVTINGDLSSRAPEKDTAMADRGPATRSMPAECRASGRGIQHRHGVQSSSIGLQVPTGSSFSHHHGSQNGTRVASPRSNDRRPNARNCEGSSITIVLPSGRHDRCPTQFAAYFRVHRSSKDL